MGRSADVRVAFASLVVLLVTAAGEASLNLVDEAAPALAPAVTTALLDGHVLTLRSPDAAALRALDPGTLALAVAQGPPLAPLAFEDLGPEAVRAIFLAGAGSADAASLTRTDGGPPPDVIVATANDTLPGPRWGSAVAANGSVAYVFGGALSPSGLAGEPLGEWVALDAILSVDIETGAVRTQNARLPHGIVAASAVWDPRPSEACPAGCAYVLGGLADHVEPQDAIHRYDPASDTLTTLDVRLPASRFDIAAVWTGTAAIMIGGAFEPLRFDPLAERVESLPPHPLAYVFGGRAIFDARTNPACPQGCAYLLGGRHAADFAQPTTTALTQQDSILRLDPSTGTLAPTHARLPQRVEAPSVAWDGERAYVLGGRTCTIESCARSHAMMSFEPATGATQMLERVEAPPEDAPALWHAGSVVTFGGKMEGDNVGSTARIVRHVPRG